MPSPDTPAHTPMARPRSSAGNTLVRIDSVAGMMNAPPIPIRDRVTIRWFGSVANAERAEPTANTTMPICRAPLRPNRSPRLPAVSSSPANTRV